MFFLNLKFRQTGVTRKSTLHQQGKEWFCSWNSVNIFIKGNSGQYFYNLGLRLFSAEAVSLNYKVSF